MLTARASGSGTYVVVLAAACLLSGCVSSVSRPDLARLYAGAGGATSQHPVVVVHGVLGARLRERDSGREVWPGGFTRLAFSEYRDLALAIDPETLEPDDDKLETNGIFDRFGGREFYGAILDTLEGAGGYQRTEPGTPVGDAKRRYYVFVYDWRRDNVETVRKLDAFLARIRADHGRPDLKVDLIAHSNGGLVARYYARYGTTDVLDGNEFEVTQAGAHKVRRLILLGTPNFGSMAALRGLIEGAKAGLRTIPTEVLATMPSMYQLLPHALNDWLIDSDGTPLSRDLFDVALWRRFQWSIFDPAVRARVLAAHDADYLALLERHFEKRLERARRFTWALTVAEPAGGVRPIVFGGDCELTPARVLVEEVGGDSVLRLWPNEIASPRAGVDYDRLMLEPGDGTVTKASLLARESLDPTVPRHAYSHFPLDYSFFLCESHDLLTANVSFQDNLLHALLSVDR